MSKLEVEFHQAIDNLDEFTPEQKLQIIEKAEELLDHGNRWVKKRWHIKQAPKNGGPPVDCFCLDGALAAAVVELGFLPKKQGWKNRLRAVSGGRLVSVAAVVLKLYGKSIPTWNDNYMRKWSDVEYILKKRKTQLRAQIARRKKASGGA